MTHRFGWSGLVLAGIILACGAGAWGAAEPVFDGQKGWLDPAALVREGAALTAARYPDADDLLLDGRQVNRYQPDGRSESWFDYAVKVFTEKGRREQQSLSFGFNATYGTVTVTLVQILKPDGRLVEIDVPAMSRVMIDPSQMDSNIYDPQNKVLQVGVPGVECGDIVRFVACRREDKVRLPDTWSDYTTFEGTSPIRREVYEVYAPAERPLANVLLKNPVEGTVTYTTEPWAGGTLHRWVVRDVPRMFEEPNMPPVYTCVQRLLVSTIPNWETISTWYWNLSRPRLEKTTDAMRQQVVDLTRGIEDRQARLEALFEFVAQKIRYMGITTETEAPGYEPHDVDITFQNRYGVCRDKAALLVAMLRLDGFEAFPVLIHAGAKKDPEVPQPFFNHAIVAARNPDGSYRLMDPTNEASKDLLPGYLCNKSFLVATPEGDSLRTSPTLPAEENLVTIETKGTVRADGLLAARTVLQFHGINDTIYRGHFSRLKPEERRRFFEGLIKRVQPGARLTGFELRPDDMQDMSSPLSASLLFEAPDLFIPGRATALMSLPWFGTRVGMVNFAIGRTGLETRKYTLETDSACGVRETFTLELDPAAGVPASLPRTDPLESEELEWTQRVTARGATLEGQSTFLLHTVEFTPPQYAALKKHLVALEYQRRKLPVFDWKGAGAEAGAAPNSVVLDQATSFRLDGPGEGETRQKVRRKILTYAGVKDHAELKLSYNPAWEDVRIDHVTVTMADGQVKKIETQEVNVMDAAWVGSAPRYPPARTMVVSLPGVEIGSVVEYETVRTIKARPFLSFQQSFGAFDPVQHQRLRIEYGQVAAPTLSMLQGEGLTSRRYETNGVHVVEYEAHDLPAAREEEGLPPAWAMRPTVLCSNGDWPNYARQVRRALVQRTEGQRAAKAKARALVQGLDGRRARLQALRDFVARDIRSAGPSFTELPLDTLSPADTTLRDGYGHQADKAILLAAMLRAVGEKPEFVLAADLPDVNAIAGPMRNTPQRSLFPSVLVRIQDEKGAIYLNDTDQYAVLGATPHDGKPGLDLAQGTPCLVAAEREARDRVEQQIGLTLDEKGRAQLTVERRYFGMAHAAAHRQFAEMPPEERRRYHREQIASLSQAARSKDDLFTDFAVYPGVERFAVDIEPYAVREGDSLYLPLPFLQAALPGLRSDERTLPLFWNSRSLVYTRLTVTLPLGWDRAEILPDAIDQSLPEGAGSIVRRTKFQPAEGDRPAQVELVVESDLREALLPARVYGELLDLDRQLQRTASRMLLIKQP